MRKCTLIGVAGPFGAGKSSITSAVSLRYNSIVRLKLDNYACQVRYEPQDFANSGISSMYRFDDLVRDLLSLKAGQSVYCPFACKNELGFEYRLVNSADFILVEGAFLYTYPQVSKIFDVRIYIEAGSNTVESRNFNDWSKGGNLDRGKEIISLYDRFGVEQKRIADFIIDNSGPMDVACDKLSSIIDSLSGIRGFTAQVFDPTV